MLGKMNSHKTMNKKNQILKNNKTIIMYERINPIKSKKSRINMLEKIKILIKEKTNTIILEKTKGIM